MSTQEMWSAEQINVVRDLFRGDSKAYDLALRQQPWLVSEVRTKHRKVHVEIYSTEEQIVEQLTYPPLGGELQFSKEAAENFFQLLLRQMKVRALIDSLEASPGYQRHLQMQKGRSDTRRADEYDVD